MEDNVGKLRSLILILFVAVFITACGTGGGGTNTNNPDASDTTKPTVSQTSPANGATGVAINSSISVTFSEPIDPSTVTTSTFQVAGVTGALSVNGTTATFTPSSNLGNNTAYTVTLTTGVKDAAGNTMAAIYTCSFTTGAQADTTLPTVSSVSPANNATGTAVNAAVTATFSETMDVSTINSATFTLNQGSTPVSGTVTYSGITATFTPSSNLGYNTTYTVSVTNGVKDAAGNAMAAIYTCSFTTGAQADTTPPAVSSVSPANNATGTAVNAAVAATFSETMDASTINSTTFTLNQGSTPVSGNVTYSGTTATFTPSISLSYSTTYTATITTGANDVAGNAIASNYSWSYTSEVATASAPSAPTGVSASAGDTQATISWTAVTGATSYNIYWSTTAGVTTATGTKIAGVTSPYTHTGRTNGTTYYYIVTAVNTAGESAASSQASAMPLPPAPAAPTGVSASAGDAQAIISWTAVTGATSYNIYWSTTAGVTTATGTKIAGVTSPYTHTGRTNGTTYYYIVTAANTGGESTASSQVSATPLPPISAAPSGVTAAPGNTQTTINWSAVTGATSYNIYWSITTGVTTANGTKITGATSPYNHTGLTNGTTYYYIVTAVNLAGESAASTQVSATPNATYLMGGAIQGLPLALSVAAVTTPAGSIPGSLDGTGTGAQFQSPQGITTDGTNLYVADSANNKIRKVVIATGVVTTIAGSGVAGALDGTGTAATFYYPVGITTDGTNLYVTEYMNNKIRKIVIATGVVSTIAGSGVAGALDGTGTEATFRWLAGITTDGTSLYVVGGNNNIRKVVIATGVVTTIAGSGLSGSVDGTGTGAQFWNPQGITTNGTNLYVADSANNKLRKVVIATGVVTTIAGSGVAGALDGTGTVATFHAPVGITTDGTSLYVGDAWNNNIRKVVLVTGVVTTLAGSGAAGALDGTGTAATFGGPCPLTTDGTSLYVADTNNSKIRKIAVPQQGGAVQGAPLNLTNTVSTFAGSGTSGSFDGTGTAATFSWPAGITTDGTNLYVADRFNHNIRKVVIATGVVTTIAGSGVAGSLDGTGTAATFNYPKGITTDGTNLYVADEQNNKIRKVVIATGVVTTIAGSGTQGALDGTGTAATFYFPEGITTDGTNLYVTDTYNHKIRKIVIATGAVTTIAGSGTSGTLDGTGTAATFNGPVGITTDGTNLYVADWANNKIRKVVTATGVVTTIAGSGTSSALDGTGTAATFNQPQGITTDGTNLYVADWVNNKIRKIVIATGVVSTIAGSGVAGLLDGTGTAATFNQAIGITSDGMSLYVAEILNIRKIQ